MIKHAIGKPRGKLYACFLDFRKAYDSVWHDGLFSQLERLNIRGNFLGIIKDMCKNSHCAVKIQNKVTNFFKCEKGVRQGCPLSPILFNIFINTLAFDPDNSSTDLLELPNGSSTSCLLYADDVILISKSPEGLQNLLDSVSTFCNKWKMTVNPTKPKCILFTSKNRINKRDNFNIGQHYLENVFQFTYLVVDINTAGSFKASMDILSTKANKAKYALNNIAKLKLLPIKTALRLFDAAILQILTYGSEIWALNPTLDDDKWDISSTERIHLNFVKHILGINRSVNNLLCRAELGRYPISIEINHKILNFYKHIRELPRDSIAYQAYVIDDRTQGTCKLRTLKQHITNLKDVTGKDLLNLSKKSSKKELKNSYEILWKSKLKTCTRGICYLNFKQNIFYEKYLD